MDLQLPGGPSAPRLARSAVENLRGHIPPKALDDVRLIASELVTNSVRHGQAGPGGRVHLRIEVEHDTVRVEVTDPGPGLPRRRPDPREDQTGGWGLVVVERLSDRWGVQPGRPSAVWAEVKTSSRGAS
jgi:anti-sigma regulatory factor (Ser/Thr protein kinase)